MRTSIEQSSVGEKKAKKVALQQIKIALKSIKGKTRLLHSHDKQHLLLKNTAKQQQMIIQNSKSLMRNFNLCFQCKCGEGGL